ncbi:MAG: DUF11 domain-containing protein, partial [Saprospiraceae bacterium]|nr:DUF11 domain-containing protein [Saprospiraceae bacterium]
MRKSVIVLRRFSTLLLIVSACLATIPMLISQCAPGIIEGTVFLDKDLSGVKDATENGESGVFIRIYDKNGILISQSISSSNGKYSIPGLIDGQNYRVQFEIPSTYYLSSTDPDIGSDVQFVTSPACNVDLGILDNNSNCSGSSEIILTCFANTLAPNYDGQETLIGLVHDFDGSSAVKVYATQNETGPIWGLGFNDNNQMIYSSAFVKQHTQLTPHGHDAIFITDVSNNPNTQLFAKLSDLGQEVGELDYTDPNDCNYGKQVGTIGLGALSFNDTKDYLFIANLYNNTIVKINIDNPQPSTTAAFTVPDPGCSFGDYRIFAVEHHNSALYVGVTCTGETSLDTEDLSFHVYKFDFETEAFGLEFSTDYTKGVWNIETTGLKNNQQWLTDIDFTDDGNMVLGVSDRFGHSYCNGTTSRVDDQKGDILLVENYNGTWVLENNGETSKLRGTGVGNGEGPGGGEFFGDDYFILDREDHPDVALGSIFVMPGTNEVVSTVFDPERNTYSGGLHRYSTVNGAKVGSKELYSNNVNNYFGKATGFGNVISRCGKLLPEVGNLVWNDVDCDGTQSAGEEGIAGITVNMYDRNCNLVGTTVTNASGRYSFNKDNVDKDGDGNFDGMVVDDIYYIAIDPAQYVQPNQSYNINDVYYSLTNYSGVEQINSNAVAQSTTCSTNDLSLIPTVKFVASAGINTSLDIGLKASTEFDLALTKKLVSTQDVKENDLLTFEIKVYNQGGIVASEYEIVDYLTAAFTFNQADNPGWTIDGKNVKKVITENLTPTQNRTETLKLRLKTTADISNYVNYAEISYAKDQFGNISSDIDSNPDDVKNNDKGGYPEDITDNLYTDDGTIDEDDHDPAKVYVLDLALRNILQDVRTYDVGEFATFEMTIINQGNVAVTEFDVVNQFPTVMTFESSVNPGWTQSSAAQVVYTHSETLEVGERKKISINLRINDSYNYDDILNLAEISRIVSANPAVTRDVDSTPNAFLLDDNGGNPYDNSDNMVGDDGSFDEDDHDPAILSVRLIDLALLKTNQKDVYNPGDLVEFQITVFNQGQTSVGELMVVDYLPEYTTLADNTWAVDDTDPTGSTVYKNLNFIAGFNPGDSHTEFITLKVDEDVTSGYVINMAEIAAVYDRNGVDVSGHDVDSEPDRLRFNDNGGVFSTITDNEIRDDGTMDEDDHDPSGFYIASASFTNSCHCLSNASNIFNGQFLDSLTVTAPPGQTWYIDEVNNLYHVSSPAPPGAVVPFTTGPGGYILTEFPLTPDLSEYLLEGIFEDGKQFNIRVTNGSGVYLQASSAGYDCTYNRETIVSATDGLSAVCSGSLHSYGVVSNNSCNDFEWSLSAGGTIMGPIDQETVSVRWDIAAGGPYELTYSPLCPDMCLAPIVTEIIVGDASSSMSCHGEINVSLNNYCSSQMYANVFLTSQTLPNEAYQLMMVDSHGKVVHNNLLTREHLWKTITAKVTDPCTGNSCWSKVRVEDKSAPSIQCNDISVPCNLMESYEPLMLENCHEDATIRLIGETITPLTCDPTHIKEVKRTYVSEDGYGNISEPCEQTIRLERIPLDEIEYPEHFILNMGTNLTCIDSIYDENGNVKTEITGVPKLNGHPIYPVEDFYCNVGIDYSDFVVAEFGCVQKIMRTWRVYESWCTTGVLATPYVQTIEIADTKPPVVTCPDPIIVTSSGTDCSAEVILELPTITDDCSTTFTIDLSYDGGFNRNVKTAQQVTIESGVSQAKYFVYDQCENIDSCSINIEVLDQSNPVAVCDENTIVSLRSTGTAKAFAHTFDDGSYDDCSLFKTLVRRMDSQCDCVRPEFEDMNFLGERDGSYYYLSSFKTHGTKAFDYSSAYGGNLVVLDSEEECNWLHTQAIKYISSPYYIGLSDKGHPGQFTWEDHTEPDFNKFIGGSPADVGDNVVTNLYGDWVVVDGFDVEAYYILEVTDPCGFSDEVYFCCEDAAEIQQVVFRVVDYFGRTNECMVNVEVQDKVAPKITCPPSQDVSCERDINIEDLSEFGTATATDQCGSEISDSIIDTRNECMFGDIIRRFYASDNNGFSSCDQVLTIINTLGTTENVITWPLDFDTDLGCTQGDLHPDSLAVEFGRPRYDISNCNQLAVSYDEQRFAFAGPGSDACLKILRRWTVIDWCQMDDPDYEPETYDQVIKVNNVVGPTIQTGCDTLNIFTEECLSENVSFSATAEDDCTLPEDLKARIQIDTFSDGMGVFDIEVKMTAGQINFNGQLPIGQHFALISFTDQCNNTTTCAKIINVNNITIPTAACIDGISIAVEPMDLDGNGTPDTERACVFPEMVDASSTHVCDTPINLSFSQDTTHDKLIFDCNDLGIQTIELWVTDIFGNTALCETTVEVQDNNNEDFCPRFDLALIKTLDTIATPGPFEPGDAVTFNINVINQGNIGAFDIGLVDYVPDGLTLNDGNWTQNGDLATLNDNIVFLEDSTNVDVKISFTIDSDFMGFSLTNTAEISQADNDNDPNNPPMEDSDSTPDMINDDVVGGDNSVNSENGDEDDHDVAIIEVEQTFDLALEKDCSTGGPYMPGSTVTYILTVTNQGTVNAPNVELEDNIPSGLILNDSDWTQNGSVATLNTPIPLVAVGTSVDVEITFTIDDMFMNQSIVNTAQIIDPNNLLLEDVDSTPGNDDGDQSEDDEASKMIVVGQVFDLALLKQINFVATPGPFNTGDDVAFTVTVYNQGSIDATNVQVIDYVPEGFTFDPSLNTDFNIAGSNASAIVNVDSDEFVELDLVLSIDDDFGGNALINSAEIISANNALGLDDQDDDLANTNPNGVNPELLSDDDINDERPGTPGSMDNPNDEDDYDPAVVDVNCTLLPVCQSLDMLDVFLDDTPNGGGTVTIDPASLDDGSFAACINETVTLSIVSGGSTFDCTDLGSGNIVTLQATDTNGNVSTNDCQTDITVIDNTPPTLTCTDVTVSVNNAGQPILVESDIVTSSDDNCFVADTTIDLTGINLDSLICTPMTAVITVNDQSNNDSANCEFLITIENSAPEAFCNTPLTFSLDANGEFTLLESQVDNGSTDDCSEGALLFDLDINMFDCDDVDEVNVVVLTVTDEAGLTDTCSSTIVIEDNINPVANCQDRTVELNANGNGLVTANQVNDGSTDECGVFMVSLDNMSFDCDDIVAVQTVVLTVTDNNGNTDTCEASITVEDN